MKKLVDKKVYALAEELLPDSASTDLIQSLAADLQQAMENWFEDHPEVEA